jgi:PAS domain S-box-containing protein
MAGKNASATATLDTLLRAPFSDAELLEHVLDLGEQTYFVLDVPTNTLTWPAATFRLWGLAPEPERDVSLSWVLSTVLDADRDTVRRQLADPDWRVLTQQYRIQLPDGGTRHIRSVAKRDRDAAGRISRVFGLLKDVSDEVRIADQLQTSQAFLDLALRSAQIVAWEIDLLTGEMTGNDQLTEILGYDLDELREIERPWATLCHPEDADMREAELAKHLSGETSRYECEYRLHSKSGEWIWVLVNGQIVERDADGTPRRMAGTTLDITSRKTAEQDLGAENELLSLALRMGGLGYYYWDAATDQLHWPAETFRLWGLEPDSLEPTVDWYLSTVHPEDRDAVEGRFRDSSWVDLEHDFRILLPDGEVRYIRGQSVRQSDEHGRDLSSYGIYQDITHFRNMQGALREGEARFRSIFETSGAGIVLSDEFGEIRFINEAFANLLGFSVSELVGRRFVSLSPSGESDPVIEFAEELRTGVRTQLNLEKPYRHKDGHTVWVRLNLSVSSALNMSDAVFIGVAQDITERKEAEQRLTQNSYLLEEAQRLGSIGHWTWKPDTGTVEWSNEMYRILGLDPEQPELPVTPFRDYVHPDDQDKWDVALEKASRDGAPTAAEYRLIHRDGTVRHVMGRATAEHLPSGERRLFGTVQDLTDRKRTEDVLQKAIESAQAASQAKSKFLASMSHELRTPLNAILGFAQLLSLQTRGPLTEDQGGYVENIIQGGEHLLGLINDVLDLARIDTGQLAVNLQAVDAVEAVDRVIKSFGHQAEVRNIKIGFAADTPAKVMVLTDQMRLTQILNNFASNALKYNSDGGSVSFSLSRLDDGFVRIAVADTGRGIPDDRQDEVFQSFNRLGAEASGEEGTGIGLALSKSLVERMGGRIGFTSTFGEGSEFRVEVPAKGKPA